MDGCEWRIHASRLPDSITWAIKSIINPIHSCNRVLDHNPLPDCNWVARMLLNDIKANLDIPGKALN